jgi:hypothetical protein
MSGTSSLLDGCPPFRKWRERMEHSLHSCIDDRQALTVDLIGALSGLDDITVRIADAAACLAVLMDRPGDEFGSSIFP